MVVLVVVFAAPVSDPAAQQPPSEKSWCLPADSGARVWGSVYDSITRKPLPLLVLQLQRADDTGVPVNNGWWARTDSLGRFCIRGTFIRPGHDRLTATHLPVLGHRRAVPTHRDLRVETAADSAISLPYFSLSELDSIATQGTRDSLLAVVRDHRRQWRATRPQRYYYEKIPNCFCTYALATVIVEGDSAIGYVDPKTGVERRDPSAVSWGTIDGLFDTLERDLRNPTNLQWTVTWDPRYGYPTRWEAGTGVVLMDDYGGFSVTRFQPSPQ
jgi:hypothetical protein